MILDIKRTVIRTQLRRFLTLIVFCIAIIWVLLSGGWDGFEGLEDTLLGMKKSSLALWIGLIYALSLVVESLFELNYIYYSDHGDFIIFRYFSMSVMNKKKNSIEIPKEEFGGYQILSSFRGLKKRIVFLHRFKEKDAPYPAVSITGLSKQELKGLCASLDRWKKK
ncbi:MAG: hypothetical protein JW801_19120 [Bacteroidales bacterium]|nr:hypothetical protein [Bacteroidales bacterium]